MKREMKIEGKQLKYNDGEQKMTMKNSRDKKMKKTKEVEKYRHKDRKRHIYNMMRR